MLSFMNQHEDPDAMFQFLGAPLVSKFNPFPGCLNGMYPIRMESYEIEEPLLFHTVMGKDVKFEPHMFSDMGDVGMGDAAGIVRDVSQTVQNGRRPIVAGGDDEVSYHVLQGVQDATQVDNLVCITLDAHLDTEDEDLYHGSWARHAFEDGLIAELYVSGYRGMLEPSSLEWCKDNSASVVIDPSVAPKHVGNRKMVLCVDMDVFDPAIAPGVGYRVPGAAPTRSIFSAIESIALNNDVLALVVTELNPDRDPNNLTAVAAVGAINHFIAGCIMRDEYASNTKA